ncbi:zinc-ribbon domain-containing protein [Halorubrum sp. ASP1]|uniref:zinc ribbon domain-containing protein n=1 Tax=Halorubrum sp. ASP1 TaxID=2518114 RepID=UPI0010F7CB61|nr:zinc ribbon domain-containing protein [Halorubrum sp. ASP1]TKX59129.1 zinc-ribbon domain-containing protein [Halorubrum sp. ASP1]
MPSQTSEPGGPPPACPACGEAVPDGASFCPDCGADLDGAAGPAYCADCGAAFDDDDRFCSNCGASRSGGESAASERSSGRSKRSDDRSTSRSTSSPDESERAFRRRVQDHLDAGWDIEQDAGDRVILVDRGIGSVGVHVLLFLFTSGIGNLLYGWWHYSKLAERRRLVRGDETRARLPSSVESGGTVETVSAYLLSGLLLLIGGWIAFLSFESGTPPVALVGLAFALLGAGAAPAVRRRLGRRHGLTDFGRQRTVDHRVVRPPESVDESCVVCGEAFERGLVRRRRDETVVAGVPVRTHAIRHNHYCADCARSELFGDRVGAPSLDEVTGEAGEATDSRFADEGSETDAADEDTTVDAADGDATDAAATDSVREATDSTE